MRMSFSFGNHVIDSYVSIGAISNCYVSGIHLFTGIAKFAWEMFTWLFNVHGRWLHMLGFGAAQW